MRARPLLSAVAGVVLAWGASACNRVDTQPTGAPPAVRAEAGPGPVADATPPEAPAAVRRAAPEGAPNVLLVTIDTLRADHVGVLGAGPERTPTLDSLARQGVLFERAFAPTPLTLPSHTSILTGLLPPAHGVRHNGIFVADPQIPRLPGRLREAGWSTGAVVAALVLDARFGLAEGFDHYDAALGGRASARGGWLDRPADQVTDAALAWLAEAPRPFFLWVHYFDPHASYAPPEPFATRFADDPYAGEIAFVDAELGRLLAGLAADGERARTLVAVVADHGESLGEHGEVSHSYSLYDATQHVPMILAGPGVPEGRRVPDVVSAADLAPTLLAHLGASPLPDTDGRDLAPLLAGDAPAGPPRAGVYAETLATSLDHGFAPLHALRSDRWLYVRAPRPELYDVREDPAQLHNLLEEGAARVPEALGEALDAVLADARDLEVQPLDAETRAQLQALGYALPATTAGIPEDGMDPKDGLPLAEAFERANALYFAGRATEAEAIAAPLAGPLGTSPRLHQLLALIDLTLNRPDDALAHVDRLLELVPESSEHHVMRGYARLAGGDPAGAVASFEHAAALDPKSARAAAALMWKAAVDRDPTPAEEAANRALALEPRDAEIAVMVGDNWERLGYVERARHAYRKALALDPRSEQAHVGLASAAARQGRAEEVWSHLEAAGPAGGGVATRMRIALGFAQGGDLVHAEQVLVALVEAEPALDAPRQLLERVRERARRAAESPPIPGASVL